MRVMFAPVTGDIDSPCQPDTVMLLHMVQKPYQPRKAGRPADQAAMQSHRHHLWLIRSFFVQHIKTVFEIVEKLVARVEALGGSEPHIIGV